MPEETEMLPNKPENQEEPRIGVYVCNCGGNIGDVVHCQQVAEALSRLPNVVVSRSHMFMCSDPGQNLIVDDIKERGVNRVVVGACSPFLHEMTFRTTLQRAGLNPYLYNHVGLREQASWVHHHCPSEATDKASRLMAAGVAKARYLKPLAPIHLEAQRHVLVIGGGVAGLRAAWDSARRGLKVTLVEKSPFIGGRVARLERVFPHNGIARDDLHRLIENVRTHPLITLLTGAEVVGVKGYVGDFHVQIRQLSRGIAGDFHSVAAAVAACPVAVPDEFNYGLTMRKAIREPFPGAYPHTPAIDWANCTVCGDCLKVNGHGQITVESEPRHLDVNVGAVIVATGFRPYEPHEGELGYKTFPEVITLPQLERLLDKEGPTGGKLVWDGRPVRQVALIHCVGSRQVEGIHQPQPDGQVNDYCSRVCCTATLQAATEIRRRFPEVHIFDVYQDIRTYGRGHEDYYRLASQQQVMFLRYLAEEPPEVVKAPAGDPFPLLVKVKDYLTRGEEMELPVDLVVLATGMMPEPIDDLVELFKITAGTDRFLAEVHPKLRPVETAVPGLILAGTAQGPMNILESSAAASAAAAKVSALLAQGRVELEPFVASVDLERCQGSGECVAACPYEDAIQVESFSSNGQTVRHAVVTPANCKGCGSCVAVCPNQAIDLLGWTLQQYDAMVDALTAEFPVLEVVA
jgi:heterodisulfide reductase subunit A2